MRTDEEFLAQFGDVIDDRVAETLDDLLRERAATRRRPRAWPRVLGSAAVVLATAASAFVRHSAIAAWAIWPAVAVICLAAGWTSRA
jgi:hypothetical protein